MFESARRIAALAVALAAVAVARLEAGSGFGAPKTFKAGEVKVMIHGFLANGWDSTAPSGYDFSDCKIERGVLTLLAKARGPVRRPAGARPKFELITLDAEGVRVERRMVLDLDRMEAGDKVRLRFTLKSPGEIRTVKLWVDLKN